MTKFKKGLCIALAVIIGVVAFGAVVSFAKNDSKPVSSLEFSRGGLDPDTGKYVETNKSIYTKDKFLCNGLRIEPDFESTVEYDVYLYNVDDILIKSILGLTEVYRCDIEYAQYARIVIHPEIPEDVKEKDFKIEFWQVNKYASQLKITISKNESKYSDFENLNNPDLEILDTEYEVDSNGELTHTTRTSEQYKIINEINVDGSYDYYDVFVYVEQRGSGYEIKSAIFDENGNILSTDAVNTSALNRPVWVKMTLDASDIDEYNGVVICGQFPIESNVYVYGYND